MNKILISTTVYRKRKTISSDNFITFRNIYFIVKSMYTNVSKRETCKSIEKSSERKFLGKKKENKKYKEI